MTLIFFVIPLQHKSIKNVCSLNTMKYTFLELFMHFFSFEYHAPGYIALPCSLQPPLIKQSYTSHVRAVRRSERVRERRRAHLFARAQSRVFNA